MEGSLIVAVAGCLFTGIRLCDAVQDLVCA